MKTWKGIMKKNKGEKMNSWGKYMLMDVKTGKEIKEIKASCYGDSLEKALLEMGFKIEAVEDESESVIIPSLSSPEPKIEVKEEKIEVAKGVEIVKGPDQEKPPFTGKALEIFNLLKTEEHTLEEIVKKVEGLALSTVNNYVVYLFKSKGYHVDAHSFPGRGIVYHIK